MAHTKKYEGLQITFVEPKYRERYYGYRYLITRRAFSFQAYRTKEGLRRFLADTGLKIGTPRRHLSGTRDLIGTFSETCYLHDADEFRLLEQNPKHRKSVIMSNSDYTTAIIEERESGNIIHYLNPNVRDREVHDWRTVPD